MANFKIFKSIKKIEKAIFFFFKNLFSTILSVFLLFVISSEIIFNLLLILKQQLIQKTNIINWFFNALEVSRDPDL